MTPPAFPQIQRLRASVLGLLLGMAIAGPTSNAQVNPLAQLVPIPKLPKFTNIFGPKPKTNATESPVAPPANLDPLAGLSDPLKIFAGFGKGNVSVFDLMVQGTNQHIVQFQKPEQLLVNGGGGSFLSMFNPRNITKIFVKGAGQDEKTLKLLNLPSWQYQGHDAKQDDLKVELQPPLSESEAENLKMLEAAPEKDAVLHRYRLGLWEFRRGRVAEAVSHWEKALDVVDNRFGKDRSAARGRNYFHAESDKTFIGEPYERAMANTYLGYAYLMQDKVELARACFKNAAWEDSWEATSETNLQYQSDFVLPYYIRGMLSTGDEATLQYQGATNSCTVYAPPPAYDPSHNTLVLVDYGHGPKKYTAGRDNRELHFEDGITEVAEIEVVGAGIQTTAKTYEDLTFQAITRGGRIMDQINERKSKTKTASKYGGWGLALAGAGLAIAGGSQYTALGLMVGGWLVQHTGGYIKPKADARYWDNLPACLTVVPLTLPSGSHALAIHLRDQSGKVVKTLEGQVTVTPGKIAAAYVSQNPKSKGEAKDYERYSSR